MKALLTLSLLSAACGHGFVAQLKLDDKLVEGWNPYKDPQKKGELHRITRAFNDNGPVTDGKFLVRFLRFFSTGK